MTCILYSTDMNLRYLLEKMPKAHDKQNEHQAEEVVSVRSLYAHEKNKKKKKKNFSSACMIIKLIYSNF